MRLRRTLALLILSAAAAVGQAGDDTQIAWWSGTWEAAFAEAKLRNVPVIVAFIQDEEEANERVVSSLFPDPVYRKAVGRCVAIVLSRSDHAKKSQVVDGETLSVCAKFGATTCVAHKALEPYARGQLVGDVVQTPQHVVVLPDGKVVDRIIDVAEPSAFAELVAKAVKKLGRGLDTEDARKAKAALKAAAGQRDRGEFGAAAKTLDPVLPSIKSTPLETKADEVLAAIDAAAAALVATAKADEANGDALLALRKIEKALVDFDGTRAVPGLKREGARMRATKAGSEASRVLAKEARGRPSFDAAKAAEQEKDWLRARREYLKAAKLAASTPLAAEAERKIAELVKDSAIAQLFEREAREEEAQERVREAEKLLREGSKEMAKLAFEAIVKDFPGTKAAETAQKKLEALR